MGVLHVGHLAWELLLLLLLFVVCCHGDSDGQALPRLHTERVFGEAVCGLPRKWNLCVVRVWFISVCVCVCLSVVGGGLLARCRVWAAILSKGHVCVCAWDSQWWLILTLSPQAAVQSSYKVASVCTWKCVRHREWLVHPEGWESGSDHAALLLSPSKSSYTTRPVSLPNSHLSFLTFSLKNSFSLP